MRMKPGFLLLAVWLLPWPQTSWGGDYADTLITNAKFAGAGPNSASDSLAIKDGKILRIGTAAALAGLRGPATQVLPAGGRRLTPGLVESHGHMISLGAMLQRLDLKGLTRSAVLDKVAQEAARLPKGTWIRGRGWDQNLWQQKVFPTRAQLDRVAPDHPVVLTRVDGHAAWVNSLALGLAGIDAQTPVPAGGRVVMVAGQPSGILIDQAMPLVFAKVPAMNPELLASSLVAALQHAARLGLTLVTEAGLDQAGIDLYLGLLQQGKLPIRVNIMLQGSDSKLLARYLPRGPINIENKIFIRSIKLMADGALGSRGAALLADYSDEPGHRGLLLLPLPQVLSISKQALAHGYQVATHAIGDGANRLVLDAYEQAFKAGIPQDPRFRIEHAQIIAPQDIDRFRQLGVIASMQATHCTSDSPWVPQRLGAARTAASAYIWRQLKDAGVKIAGGSDAPVEDLNPLWGFYAFETRQDHHGLPREGWQPQQRLTRQESLLAYTRDAAFAAFQEDQLGALQEGMLADLVLFADDIITIPSQELLKAKVAWTMVGGKLVYQQSQPTKI